MSFWMRDPREGDAEVVEDLSYPPTGGPLKMWLLGIGLALVPICYGLRSLKTGRTRFFDHDGGVLDLTGPAAVAMAIAYIAVGVFIHAHWFWGLHPRLEPMSLIPKVMAILVFLGSFGYAAYKIIVS